MIGQRASFLCLFLLTGAGCGGGGDDDDSASTSGPKLLAADSAKWPGALAMDQGNLYLADSFSNAVHKVFKASGKAVRLYGDVEDGGEGVGIAVDSTSVYLAQRDGTIVKIPLGGGEALVLATGQREPSCIAVDDTYVYWSAGAQGRPGSAVYAVPLDGGAISDLGSSKTFAAMATDEGNLYFTGNTGIMKLPASGGAPVEVTTGTGGTEAIAIHGDHVFWSISGTVGKAPLTGGPAELLAPSVEFSTSDGVAADDDFAYFTEINGRGAMRIPVTGGEAEVLLDGPLPEGIVVDDSTVYVADAYRRGIVALPK